MAIGDDSTLSEATRIPPTRVIAAGLGLVVAAAVAFFLVFRFVDAERERDLVDWQVRMGIIADGRTAEIEKWLAAQFDHLGGLSQNASLQIYLMALGEPADQQEQKAEEAYLRNLLIVSADNFGYAERTEESEVRANVAKVGTSGIGLVDMKGRPVVATRGMPPLTGRLAEFLAKAPRGERAVRDLYRGPAGAPSMAFATPVFAVHGDRVASEQIGFVLGVKEVAAELYPLLKQIGNPSRTAETMLVRRAGEVIEYLSPLADDTAPLGLKLSVDTPELAAASATASPGVFGLRRDYANKDVLATSRRLTLAPWTLVYKVDRAEALADSDSRLRRLTIVLSLIVAAVAAALIAAWRYGTSRRAEQLTRQYRATAEDLDKRQRFLQVLTDKQPSPIFTISGKGVYGFANAALSRVAGIPAEDIVGKTMDKVLGPHYAKRYESAIRTVVNDATPVTELYRIQEEDDERVFQAEHVPIRNLEDTENIALVIEEDITLAVKERERRERTMRQVVRTLVSVADGRDDNAAGHSTRAATVARWTADEMELDLEQAEAVELAASLMNVGKLLIPRAVLNKPGALSDEEIELVQGCMDRTVGLLSNIEFDGPVIDIIAQSRERWDGSGRPQGLAGEEIDIGARIVAAANAFVAMTSARAYRGGQDVESAIEGLLASVGKDFDRRAVVALVHFFENAGGRDKWQELVNSTMDNGLD